MNPHNNLVRTAQVPTFRRLRTATAAALPALVAVLTTLSLAMPSLAQAVPSSLSALPVLYVDKDAAEGGDGSSWENAYRYLHDALEHATGGQIWVAEGVYYPDEGDGQTDGERTHSFRLVRGVAVYGGFNGTETSVGERDWLGNVTVLSGDLNQNDTTDGNGVVTDPANIVGIGEEEYDNSYHVVTASDVSLSAELNGFVITAGVADGNELENHDKGAGIFNDDATPTLIHLVVRGNKADSEGGGMFSTKGSPSFTNVTFRNNLATVRGGGFSTSASDGGISNLAFYNNEAGTSGGGMYLDTTIGQSLSNLTFNGNTAVTGGGLYAYAIGPSTLSNSTFTSNTAEDGGGLYLDAQDLDMSSTTFATNSASDQGGGIFAELGNYTLTGVTLNSNQAGAEGGGLYGERNVLHVVNSVLTGNTSVLGGGIYVDDYGLSTYGLTVSGTDLIANTASEDGGGLYVVDSQGQMSSSAFTYNEATTGDGGGFYLMDSSPFVVSNTDFEGNDADAGSGGGMYVSGSDPALVAVTFDGNDAMLTYVDDTMGGGGLHLTDGSNATLSRCAFTDNSAANGGGVYISGSSPALTNVAFVGNLAGDGTDGSGGGLWKDGGQPTLKDVLFSGNRATTNGGGMHNGGAGSSVEATNLTFSGNRAVLGTGGGLHSDASSNMIIHNTVVWNNQDSSGIGTASASIWDDPDAAIDHSLIENLALVGDGNLDGTDPGNDPLFVVPVDPSTAPTTSGIVSVKFGSPIVDVGDNTPIAGVTVDLADNPRIYNGTVDMGAYELQLACPPELITRLYVDRAATLGNTGVDWLNALKDLRDAFTLAENCPGIGEIWVAAGVYRPDEGVGMVPGSRPETYQLLDGVKVYGGFAGGETLLEERDWVTNATVLSGDVDNNDTATGGIVNTPAGIVGDNSYHVVASTAVGDTTVLDGFTITAGQANGTAPDPTSRGGGIYNDAGSPTLANLTFIGNFAREGGGVANLNGADSSLTDMVFENNMATSTGGGIYNVTSSPVLSNLVFTGNYAGLGAGM
ncbi:MAG: choice-of-anchor Q domain-containing protein, partial [Anaerolineae bacterium]